MPTVDMPALLTPSGIGAQEVGLDLVHSERSTADVSVASSLHLRVIEDLLRCTQADARSLIPESLAKRYVALPLAVLNGADGCPILLVCCGDDYPSTSIAHELRFASGCTLEFEIAPREAVLEAIRRAYRISAEQLQNLAKQSQRPPTGNSTNSTHLPLATDLVPQILESIIDRAVALRASDIHYEYNSNGVSLRYRVDGILTQEIATEFSIAVAKSLLRCLKVRAGLDITHERVPQEGGFFVEMHGTSVRVSVVPVVGGEKAVLRLLGGDEATTAGRYALDNLGLQSSQRTSLNSALFGTGGVLLFSGPTGSGKSTLLRAVMHELKHVRRNIIAIEDPVEETVPFVSHLEVDRARNLDYAELLAPVLRQDPDVLVIGEIRDRKTAEMALNAGLTGHVVISTVHAGSSVDVLLRLRQFGLSWDFIALSIRLVSSQRLLGLVCPHCRAMDEVSSEFRVAFSLPHTWRAWSGMGCECCRWTGVLGRTGVFEFLPVTGAIRSYLLSCKESTNFIEGLISAAQGSGFEPIPFAVRNTLLQQKISPETALTALGIPRDRFHDEAQ